MKRILHVIGIMNLGGAEAFIMNVYRKIDRTKVQFDFVTHSLDEGAYDAEILRMGGRIFRIQPPHEAGFINSGRALGAILKKQGPFAAVHSHVQKYSGFVAMIAAWQHVPVRVVHSHTSQDPRNNIAQRWLYGKTMSGLIHQFGTTLAGCSKEACQTLFGAQSLSDNRLMVLHNGVDPARFIAQVEKREEARAQLGISEDAIVLLHVGNFCTPKNHRFLLEVFRATTKLEPKAHLVLVGDGVLMASITSLISEWELQSHVTMLGRRRDVPALLGASDLFIFPSLWEGVPTALIEAQVAGLPCIASDRISREVDLGLGLIAFRSLEIGSEQWASESIQRLKQHQHVETAVRVSALQQSGYDISTVARTLEALYCASVNSK